MTILLGALHTGRMASWSPARLAGRAGWLAGSLAGWLTQGRASWLFSWPGRWLTGWPGRVGEWTGVRGLGDQVDGRVGGRARWRDDRWTKMQAGGWAPGRAANRSNPHWV